MPLLDDQRAAGQHRVEHFWLCGSCSNIYVFEYQPGAGMNIKLRATEPRERAALNFVTAA